MVRKVKHKIYLRPIKMLRIDKRALVTVLNVRMKTRTRGDLC